VPVLRRWPRGGCCCDGSGWLLVAFATGPGEVARIVEVSCPAGCAARILVTALDG